MKSLRRLMPVVTFLSALLLAGQCFAESIVATVPGQQPISVAVNPFTRLAYVANFFTPTIQVISEETNSVVDTIIFPPGPDGQNPEFSSVAINPFTSRLYGTDGRAGLVYVIAIGRNNRTLTTIAVPGADGVAVNPRINKLYVSSFFLNTVTIIDGKTNTVTGTLSVTLPFRATADMFSNRVYLPSQNFFGQVFVLDGDTDAVLAQIQTGNFTTSVGVDFVRHLAYASNNGFTADTSSVSIIDTDTNTVIGTIATDTGPSPVAVDPFTNRIYVANTFQPQDFVDVIDGRTRQIIQRLPIDPNPTDAAIDPAHHTLYFTSPNFVVSPGGNVVTVIDISPQQ